MIISSCEQEQTSAYYPGQILYLLLGSPFNTLLRTCSFSARVGGLQKKSRNYWELPLLQVLWSQKIFKRARNWYFCIQRDQKGPRKVFYDQKSDFLGQKKMRNRPPSALRKNFAFWRAPLKALQVLRSLVDSALICPLSWQSTCRVWQAEPSASCSSIPNWCKFAATWTASSFTELSLGQDFSTFTKWFQCDNSGLVLLCL